jgi:hypothetical protein
LRQLNSITREENFVPYLASLNIGGLKGINCGREVKKENEKIV